MATSMYIEDRMIKKYINFLFSVPVILCVLLAYPGGSGFTAGFLPPDSIGPMRQLTPSSRRSPLIISEIMYHPLETTDGKNLEFVELFNTEPVDWDISGFRLEGQIGYTFPAGTILAGRSFAVVAAEPASL